MTRRIRALVVLAAIAVVILTLHLASQLGLRGPTGVSSTELSTWFGDPVAVVATFARWVALVLAYYLFAAVAALALAKEDPDDEVTGIRRLIPSGIASMIGLALGLSATAGPAALHMATTGPTTTITPPAMLTLAAFDAPLTLDPQMPEAATINPADHAGTVLSAAPAPQIWEVRTGDSLWAIAEETVMDGLPEDEEITDETIAAYWRVLIDANVDRLVEPGNPDLIIPGQEFVLPPISRGPMKNL